MYPNERLNPPPTTEGFPPEVSDETSTAIDARSSAIAGKAGAITALVGATVLAGWFSDILMLTTIVAGGVGMKANAALGFVLAGTSLWFNVRLAPRSWQLIVARCTALAVALLGAATLAEYAFQ